MTPPARLASLVLVLLGLAAPKPAAARDDTLTVVTLNLWHDQQDWPRRRALIVAELRALEPDIVCLQEVLQHETLPNQAYALAESLGCDVAFSSTDRESSTKRYGNAILSRHPILERSWKPLEPRNDYRTALHARIDVHGVPLDVFDTHLHHTAEGGAIRAEQIRDLLAYVKAHRGRGAVLLAGDFNAAPTVPELQDVKKGFLDALATVRGTVADTMTTLNPHKGHAPRRIDYVFLSRDGRPSLRPLASEVVFDVPGADGTWPSDHFGVAARVLIGR